MLEWSGSWSVEGEQGWAPAPVQQRCTQSPPDVGPVVVAPAAREGGSERPASVLSRCGVLGSAYSLHAEHERLGLALLITVLRM